MKTAFGTSALLAASLFFVAACDNNPVENKPLATVGQAAAVAPVKNAEAVRFRFSEAGSTLSFVGAKVTGKHDGAFGTFRGEVAVVGAEATQSRVTVEIDMGSVSSDHEKLTGHLKSPDFFDTERFPKAKFVSTRIASGAAAPATHIVTGNLELHGVTKSISFPATIGLGPDTVTVRSEFGINRKDFGIVYPGKPDDLIKDEVLIRLDVKANRG